MSGSVEDLLLPQEDNDEYNGRQRKWLEMDLGKCMVELVDDSVGTENAGGGSKEREMTKRFVSFWSLEVDFKD